MRSTWERLRPHSTSMDRRLGLRREPHVPRTAPSECKPRAKIRLRCCESRGRHAAHHCRGRLAKTPRTPCGGVFLASAQTMSLSAVAGASAACGRYRSEAVNIDHGQLVYPSLNRLAMVMDLHEHAPVGRWATSGRHRWRLERFAEVCENLTSRGLSHPGLRLLANLRFEVSRLLPAVFSKLDVAAAGGARTWKLLPHPSHQLGPGNP